MAIIHKPRNDTTTNNHDRDPIPSFLRLYKTHRETEECEECMEEIAEEEEVTEGEVSE
jgi:hypothetical protein